MTEPLGPAPYLLRYRFSAAFGSRGPLVDSFQRWLEDVARPLLGLDLGRGVLAVGLLGASHSLVSFDYEFDSLTDVAGHCEKLALGRPAAWASEMAAEWVVPGSRRREVWQRVAGQPPERRSGLVVQWSMCVPAGQVAPLVGHLPSEMEEVLELVGLAPKASRLLVGVLAAGEDAVTLEMDLDDLGEVEALMGYLESPRAASLIAGIAAKKFVAPGSQNWIVMRKLVP